MRMPYATATVKAIAALANDLCVSDESEIRTITEIKAADDFKRYEVQAMNLYLRDYRKQPS